MLMMAAAAALPQLGDRRLAGEEHPLDVDRDRQVPSLLGHPLYRRDAHHAGVAHEHVEPAELMHGLLNHPHDFVLAGDVGVDRRRPPAERGDLGGRALRAAVNPPTARSRIAARRQQRARRRRPPRRRPPEPAPARCRARCREPLR